MNTNTQENMYLEVRARLKLSRDKASELLEFISPEKLERIENEKQLPNPDDVMLMAEKYDEPAIRNYYCAHQCPMGQHFVPEVKMYDLEKTVLKLIASMNNMHAKQDRLIEIAADGVIQDYEVEDLVNIQKELERISLAVDALQLWTEKMVSSGAIDKEKYDELMSI